MKKSNKKGISLIVLVITIIVMIILATAIILSLNSSNIVEKAKEAKTVSDLANAKNVVILAKGEWELMTSAERESNGVTFDVYAERKLQEAGYKVDQADGLTVSENGAINRIYVGDDNRQAIIPEGFTVSTKATEDTVTEGLVISDPKGNEFVWVPVDDFSKFERTTIYNGTITPPNYVSEPYKELSLTNDLTGEWAEYASMRASVQENKGFYIGRYETGTSVARKNISNNGTTDILVQKNKPVYNFVGWGPSMISVSGDVGAQGKGAVELSRSMYYGSSSVVSTLCYGVQWDSALQFIATNPEHAEYPMNSTGKGNYGKGIINTGSNENYETNNIYDMAGNVNEWTMESYLTIARLSCGGYIDSGMSAAECSYWPTTQSIGTCGFRVALYLK